MSERVEEIRRLVHGKPDAIPGMCGTIGVLMNKCGACQRVAAALAQAEREREQAHVCPACGETTIAQDSALVADLRAEVERLKEELEDGNGAYRDVMKEACAGG